MTAAAETLDPYRSEIEDLIQTTGASAGVIAKRYGTTRGTVIGWAVRRGVRLNRDNIRTGNGNLARRARKRRSASTAMVVIREPIPSEAATPELAVVGLPEEVAGQYPEPLRIPFADAERHQCHRPLWGVEARTGDVCGLPVKPGSSYCPGCHAVLLLPPPSANVAPAKSSHAFFNPRRS